MTREIKFRVWDNNHKTMHHDINIGFTTWGEVLVQIDDGETPYFKKYYKDKFTVQQYTGLKDENGKEIYEGDILRLETDGWDVDITLIRPVVFGQGMFGIKWPEQTTLPYMLKITAFTNIAVVGNIHENAELLNDKK